MLGDAWDEIYNIPFTYSKGLYQSRFCQCLCAFDIEVSNGWRQSDGSVLGFDHDKYKNDESYRDAIDNGDPVSCLYIWQIALESGDKIKIFMGRTWEELDDFLDMLTTEVRRQAVYGLQSVNRFAENAYAKQTKNNVSMVIYVHNLGFEFQHLRNLYDSDFRGKGKGHKREQGNIFARQSRKPFKAHFNMNKVKLEFKDSLVLVGKSLKAWCRDEKLPVQKLEEPKDYYLEMRTPNTDLTDEEIQYSINDVESMIYGLKKYREKYETLGNIPMTQTGEIRRRCRSEISRVNKNWAKLCHDITTSYTPDEFKRLVRLFQGGWTHANKMYVGDTVKDVKCFDFASSYPFCMCTRTMPLGKFQECDVKEFADLEAQDLQDCKYRWYMKIKVNDVISKLDNSYWSLSKVAIDEDRPIEGQIVDNGRIFCCDYMYAYMTDLDWDTYKKCYNFKDFEVLELYKSEAGYLPNEMIEVILDAFSYKTSLKGVPDSETLYQTSKSLINSIYGVMVTKIISAIVSFSKDGWESAEPDDETFYEMINQTKEEDSFTMYQIGVWVTSWARHNLFDFITKLDKHIAYCDTDSLKGPLTDEDLQFIEDYNKGIVDLENRVASILGIDPDKYTALTSKGKVKRLGCMEREDDAEEFRTLGAKRYVDKVNGEIECTIAGLPKSAAKAKIKSVDDFEDGLVWDTRESEKLIARYEDNQKPCMWVDRDGKVFHSNAKFGICLQPTTFDLSISEEFAHFLDTLMYGRINTEDDFFDDTPSWFFN
ncbi:MAG: hypothetical protein J6S67_12270 [Methanobrevibacter sp.]|nr:hypothetical protein [Methanobrevibacter sp.]